MPIIRYFVFVGGILLALLIAADGYLPAPVALAGAADPDKTTIRITSARRLPEKIVLDTNIRAVVPNIARAEPISELPPQQIGEAMAAMPAERTGQIKKEPPARVFAEARRHPRRSSKSPKRAPERRLAFERHDPFSGGWW
ncbi:hypothetical protein [Bradyrhizobium centrosematis]|uniref:hypothetical protein n=1 Tax=Bradyrhizobium centrosematis TaxID=1300039 RepID=UPI00388D3BF2